MIAWLRRQWSTYILGEPPIDGEAAAKLRERWPATTENVQSGRVGKYKVPPCSHCGGWHARACPRVKMLKFHPNKEIAEVEFWPRWNDRNVVWPEDVEAA